MFDDGLGLLHMACISQNLSAVQCLVAAGVDQNSRDTQGQSTLLCACDVLQYREFPLHYIMLFTMEQCRLNIGEFLL